MHNESEGERLFGGMVGVLCGQTHNTPTAPNKHTTEPRGRSLKGKVYNHTFRQIHTKRSEAHYRPASPSRRSPLQFFAKERTRKLRETEFEHTCWDPKDGELCLSRAKPGETLVEARSDTDVQIVRLIWV